MVRPTKRQPLNQQLLPVAETDLEEPHERPRRVRRRRVELLQDEEDVGADVVRDESDDEILQGLYPFCCAVCHCSEKKKRETIPDPDDAEFIACNTDCHHRRCCHNGVEVVKAKDMMYSIKANEETPDEVSVAKRDLNEYIYNAHRLEKGYFNTDNLEMEADKLFSNPDFMETVVKPFSDRTKTKRKEGFTVLDLFGGIGTALVVLKRLKIPIKKVIHVEHDKVATFVSRMNHDYAFVESLRKFASKKREDGYFDGYAQLSNWKILDDGIEHVYYDRFEDIFDPSDDEVFRAFAETHVANEGIDLIIGGPPCVDYSLVNANRKGTEGDYGRYMLLTGNLFQKIQKHQEDRNVFIMIENVVISNFQEREKISEAFGFTWDPIELDAWQVSPCRRRRHFFTNIPYSDTTEGHRYCAVTPETCLDDGYVLAQMLVPYTGDENGDDTPWRRVKTNTFMASKARLGEIGPDPNGIKDRRMHIFKRYRTDERNKKGKCVYRYLKRIYNVTERERIMGYPEGYVSEPVSMLFTILWFHGYARFQKYQSEIKGKPASTWPLAETWREMLPPELHIFAGNFLGPSFPDKTPFNFREGNVLEFIPPILELSPPSGGDTLTYYNHTEYAMRLIGNAFSVPAVEQILFRLKELYDPSEEERCKELYSKWQYDYKWVVPEPIEIAIQEEDDYV